MSFIRKIKKRGRPYIISEIGSNHNGNMALCKKQILQSKKAGADAVKFQMFTSSGLFSSAAFSGKGLKKKDVDKFSLNIAKLKEIHKYCKKIKIDFGVTPLSINEARLLNKNINLDFFKVASADCNFYELIKFLGNTKKPTIVSTGLSSYDEIKKAVKTFKKTKNKKLVIMHCTSNYPPENKNINLKRIGELNRIFNYPIGFSDHSKGIEMSLASIAFGACVIEKHYTSNKKLAGWDHHMSINFNELKDLVSFSKNIYESLGSKKIYRVEKKNMILAFRRSIVASTNIKKGQKIRKEHLDFKRPGSGLSPDMSNAIIGRKAKKNISHDEILKPSFFK